MGAWSVLSAIIGWTYFAAWSVSFYPQLVLNWKRRAVTGLSLDFLCLNVLGFACYSIYTIAFLTSSALNDAYRKQHPKSSGSAVRVNDAVFAVHAFFLSSITLFQFYVPGYKRERDQVISKLGKAIILGSLAIITVLVVLAWQDKFGWIDVIYALSSIKLVVSLVKLLPQLWLNYRRRSTTGWSIINPLLDLTGGLLSLIEIVIDCAVSHDWSGLTGNAVKTCLGSFSIIFDTLFILQHYCLYANQTGGMQGTEDAGNESERLLRDSGTTDDRCQC